MAPDSPLFTVIIATHNRSDFLTEAVDSVLAQTVQDFELVVVDDAGSVPATVVDHPKVRLVRRAANGGQGASFNTGMQEGRGRYYAFLDDDDLFTPARLEYALEGFERAPVVVCRSAILGEDRPRSGRGRKLEGDVRDVIRDDMCPSLGRTAVARDVALPFDEQFRASADVEWWIRMAQVATVATVEGVGQLIRRHDTARHGNSNARRIEAKHRMLELHREYFASHPRGAAFQWKRIGVEELREGHRAAALSALGRSFVRHPEPRTLLHMARALLPGSVGD